MWLINSHSPMKTSWMRCSHQAPGLGQSNPQGKKCLVPPGYWTRTSVVGACCHNHQAAYYNQNLTVDFISLPQSKTDPVHILLPSCCATTRHFSLPHHLPGISWINLHYSNHGKYPIFLSLLAGCLIPMNTLLPSPKIAYTFGSRV